jgi:hypothetical protein
MNSGGTFPGSKPFVGSNWNVFLAYLYHSMRDEGNPLSNLSSPRCARILLLTMSP